MHHTDGKDQKGHVLGLCGKVWQQGRQQTFWEKKPKASPVTDGARASQLLDPSLAKADLTRDGGSDEL